MENGSNESIYILDLIKLNWEHIPSTSQKEKNQKVLPGPRDDFLFISPRNSDSDSYTPMYLVGGFKNGQKMNDIYKLESNDGKTFIWEQILLN